MERRDAERLAHILDYCEDIAGYLAAVGNSYERFLADSMCQHSVAFCILQIGELSGKLSAELRENTEAEIRWSSIRGMRNIVAHDYGNIDLETVWDAATGDVPKVKAFCEKRLPEANES
jgi:uncharacterized protein with HEPN domain